jgi:hypothetical protein
MQALLMDSLELGLTWLEQRWQEDIVAHYPTDIRHRPADRQYDLHFHCPVCLAPVSGIRSELGVTV